MKNIVIMLVSFILVLSSCTLWEKTLEEETKNDQNNQLEEIEVKEEEKLNEMTDTKTEEEAIEEFDKEVEEILKLLEDNG